MKFKLRLLLIILLSTFSLNTIAQSKGTSKNQIKAKKLKAYWFTDKEFAKKEASSINHEEGGPDFLKIQKNKTASIKQGDIVYPLKWELKGAYIYFKSEQLSKIVKFKVYNNYLIDEYGLKWFEKSKTKPLEVIKDKPNSLSNTTWIIEQFIAPRVNLTNKSSTLKIDANKSTFVGNDGCNTISGEVIIDKNKITFKNIRSTRMACEQMEQSQTFVNNLTQCNNYKIEFAQLSLFKDEMLLMTLENYR